MFRTLTTENTLPKDGDSGTLIGWAWRPDVDGPSVVVLRNGEVFDISNASATMSELLNGADPLATIKAATGTKIGSLEEILANTTVKTAYTLPL
ncbi:hypothetical protein OAN307_c45460 [Octadecabacter antarcticus 307]|uniref:Uncharacterized protein n=1 Tax=Octadecabacter antarcticus 307 TaxID=391626 RepID=M9RCJ3_9RHOB|nr:hypothetical protein [Octadecabacter antarcticus]AGI69902.1 hypothetical protein OAN307_c45460 [Octadecabacter antarcticus 307]